MIQFAWLATGLVALVFELFVREVWGLDSWSPDFMTVLVLWWGLGPARRGGAISVGMLGLLADGFAGAPVGVHPLHASILYGVARLIADRVEVQGFFGRVLIGLAGGLASALVLVLIGRTLFGDTALPQRVGQLFVPRVLVTVVLVPVVFPLLGRLQTLASPSDGAVVR